MRDIKAGKAVNNNKPFTVLESDSGKSLRTLIRISEQMVDLAERETQALVRDDRTVFSILQDEKEYVLKRYEQASAEFRARLEEFRGADRVLLNRLETLQNQLGEKARGNGRIVERMHNRSKERVKSSLLTVQELAQSRPVNFTEILEAGKEQQS